MAGRAASGLLSLCSMLLFSLLFEGADYSSYSLILSIAVALNIFLFQWLSFGSIHLGTLTENLKDQLNRVYLRAFKLLSFALAFISVWFVAVDTILSLAILFCIALASFDFFIWKLHMENKALLFVLYDLARASLVLIFGTMALLAGLGLPWVIAAVSLAYFLIPLISILVKHEPQNPDNLRDSQIELRRIFISGLPQALLFSSIPSLVATLKWVVLMTVGSDFSGGGFFLAVDISALLFGMIFYSLYFAIRPVMMRKSDESSSTSNFQNSQLIFKTVVFSSAPWAILLYFTIPILDIIVFDGLLFTGGTFSYLHLAVLIVGIYLLFFKSMYLDLQFYGPVRAFLPAVTSFLALVLFVVLSWCLSNPELSDLSIVFFCSVATGVILSIILSRKFFLDWHKVRLLTMLCLYMSLLALSITAILPIFRGVVASLVATLIVFILFFFSLLVLVNLFRVNEIIAAFFKGIKRGRL